MAGGTGQDAGVQGIHTVLYYYRLMYSMVVPYIKDHGGLGFSGQNITQNQFHNTILVPWQYWLGITKPKSPFSMTMNA